MNPIQPSLPEILEKLRRAQSMLSSHRKNPMAKQRDPTYLPDLQHSAEILANLIDNIRDTHEHNEPPFDADN